GGGAPSTVAPNPPRGAPPRAAPPPPPQGPLPLLLDAAAILSSEVDAGRLEAFTWALAGEGPGRQEAAERIAAEQLPVTLLGRRSDAPALMEAADIVIQTSLWEGQPLTIQEALRAGAAIVATDVGGTAVTARGGAILVVPQAQAIAEALETLLSDPESRSRAAQRAREAAQRLPGLEDLCAQLRQAIRARD
ncbi:glycosyltransferase, group 1 family protein, partial [Actinomyces sp. oral taxon 171 str. F0337]